MTYLRYFLISSALLLLVFVSGHLATRRPVAPPREGECTTTVISARASTSGRPMLWKNRDVSQPNQVVRYFHDGIYPYITLNDAMDTTKAFGGFNSAGFAIEDANNLNCPNDTIPGPDDDGQIMKLALQTCRTVEEFQTILDSTRVVGHRDPAIFGVIDTAGGAAMFETFSHSYLRYDASDTVAAPLGILVRSNYSYAGSAGNRIGVFRHNRAKTLLENASRGDSLTPQFICRWVARDLCNELGLNPYPLPYQGTSGNLPQGWISTVGSICRRLSVSGVVIESVLPGEHPLLSTLWAFPIAVQYGVALPFWIPPRTTPPEVCGDSLAALCNEGLRIKTIAQHASGFHDTLDTYVIVDGHGGGVYATTLPLEQRIFQRADSALALWRAANTPDSAGMTTLSAELATMAYDTLRLWPQPGQLWSPPRAVNSLTLYYVPTQGLTLRWDPVTEDTLGLAITPARYDIHRLSSWSSTPDSIGTTTGTSFVIPLSADTFRYFDVRAVR